MKLKLIIYENFTDSEIYSNKVIIDPTYYTIGIDGEKGENGEDGDNGLSAYEIALENGFVGNESEWLDSLKGQDGQDGQDGEDGVNGQDGQDLTLEDFNVVPETTTLVDTDEFLVKKDGVWKKITKENLLKEYTLIEINLLSANWLANEQTVTITGLTETSDVMINPPIDRTQFLAFGNSKISATSIGIDTITFTCSTAPTIDINNVLIRFIA